MPKWGWLILMLALLNGAAHAADPGDAVLFRGTPGAPVIDEPDIRVGGVPVATVGAASAEYSPALLATTEHITLFGEQTIDGVLTSADAIVVWMQTAAAQNGIYLSSSGAWTRRTDVDTGAELAGNKAILVQAGARFANTVFRVQNVSTITVGTTAIIIAPEAPQWFVMPVQTIGDGGTADCTPPSAGQVIGTIVPLVSSGGPVGLGDPQILPGTRVNQLCLFEGTSDTDTVDMGDGNGVNLVQSNTPVSFLAHTSMLLRWTGTIWRQLDQTGISGLGTELTTLQQACNNGLHCGWDVLTDLRPLRIAPSGDDGPKLLYYDDGSGDFTTARVNGDNTPAAPDVIRLRPGHPLLIQALLGAPTASWQDVGSMTNVGGVGMEFAGIFAAADDHIVLATGAHDAWAIRFTPTGFAETTVQQALDKTTRWHMPWSAGGAVPDGTSCVTQAPALINLGPRLASIVCADAAGTIDFSLDTPARYDGGAVTACFEINDAVDADNIWDASVIAQFRPSGAVVNNTWSSPVEASVTLATANAGYFACANLTPNGAAPGVGRLFIRATIDNAGSHNDTNGRILGGYLTGR